MIELCRQIGTGKWERYWTVADQAEAEALACRSSAWGPATESQSWQARDAATGRVLFELVTRAGLLRAVIV